MHNKEFQQSVTLEFRRDSAWKSLAFKEVVKDGVGRVAAFPAALHLTTRTMIKLTMNPVDCRRHLTKLLHTSD